MVPWLRVLGFLFLTVNSILAVRRADGDRGAVAFVALSYLGLLLLFWCLRVFERAPPGSAARSRAKIAVWLLATALMAGVTWKVAAALPLPFAVLAWAMVTATTAGGFYAFFLASM